MCINDTPDVSSQIRETISSTAKAPWPVQSGEGYQRLEGEGVGLFFDTCQKAVIQQSWKVSFTHR